jgi:hypothetical protein
MPPCLQVKKNPKLAAIQYLFAPAGPGEGGDSRKREEGEDNFVLDQELQVQPD